MEEKLMTILLIEDDESECERFRIFEENNTNIKIVGITNSSNEGIEYFKTYIPEAVIVDIELHKGQGSGLDFIEQLRNINTSFKPLIVVTTNASSTILYNKLHEDGADIVFYKKQEDYSPKLVISTLLSLRKTLYKYNKEENNNQNVESIAEHDNKISNKIDIELNLIGISAHLQGRKYLHDAITFLVNKKDDKDKESVFNYLANKYKRTSSSISRVMQTAIKYAWRNSSPEDLEIHYKTIINYNTGVPSPTEFIYYYAGKIKKLIWSIIKCHNMT